MITVEYGKTVNKYPTSGRGVAAMDAFHHQLFAKSDEERNAATKAFRAIACGANYVKVSVA